MSTAQHQPSDYCSSGRLKFDTQPRRHQGLPHPATQPFDSQPSAVRTKASLSNRTRNVWSFWKSQGSVATSWQKGPSHPSSTRVSVFVGAVFRAHDIASAIRARPSHCFSCSLITWQMASGSLLLRQLQERRRPLTAASPVPSPAAVSDQTRIVVCSGVDCMAMAAAQHCLKLRSYAWRSPISNRAHGSQSKSSAGSAPCNVPMLSCDQCPEAQQCRRHCAP